MGNDKQKDAACAKKKKAALSKAFLDRALSSVWKALCPALKAVLNAAKNIFEVQVTVLTTTLSLQEVFIENFVVFPARAVESTVSGIGNTSQKLNEFGINRECPSHETLHKNLGNATAKIKAVGRFFGNTADQGEALIQGLKDDIAKLEESIQTTLDLLDITCP